MISRIRLIITAFVVCHLLVAAPLVTSQLLFASPLPQIPPAAGQDQSEDVTIRSLEQEKDGVVYKLRGQAEIHYGTYILYADEITYNSETGESTADGHVVLDGGPNDEHIQASHGVYNLKTESGKFDNVTGVIGMDVQGARLVLTSQNPFYFTGKTVEKTGPDHYLVHDGTVTTCQLPRPKWQFNSRKIVVDVAGDAKIYNSTFNIEGVPILFLPFATHPVQKQRQSGFMIPNIGNSSRKGTVLGESIYWAINRTMDATIGTEYFSKRGWAPQGEFRARPSEKSYVDLTYLSVLDRGILQQVGGQTVKVDQGGTNLRLDAESVFRNFRAVGDVDYLSSYVFRLAFNEIFTQAVNSEVKSQGFLSNTTRGFSYNVLAQRYQNFESTATDDVITILHAPTFDFSTVERRLGRTPFYWSNDAAAEGLYRSQCINVDQNALRCLDKFSTAPLVGRFDLHPRLSLPLLLRGWSFRTEIGLRDTIYTQRLNSTSGTEMALSDPINRKAVEGSFEIVPPSLQRVFGKELWGRKWKHVIEPRVTYRYVTGVDNFDRILRFDARDILSDTNEVEYGVVSRLYAKRTSSEKEDCGPAGMPSLMVGGKAAPNRVPWEDQPVVPDQSCTLPETREIITWELAQKYFIDPTFGGALTPGIRNVFTTTVDLTGIAFLTDARRLSPLISRLKIQTTARTDAQWDLDYDIKKGRINASTALVNYRVGPFTVGGGDAYLRLPGEPTTGSTDTPQYFNQFRLLFGYGHTNKRGLSAAMNVGFDATLNFLQYAAAQATYNWDCCGVTLEYRRFNLGQVRNENQFRFTFALANIGAFGNLGRRQRLF